MEGARRAGDGDLERLVELSDMAHEELRVERGGALWARREAAPLPRRDAIAEAIASATSCVQVGVFAGQVVGYGIVHLERLRTGELLGVVTDIYVEPAFREVAVGEAVMDALIDWAQAEGCIGIDSLVLPGMRESKNFFERYGMKARAILVHRSFEIEGAEPATDCG